MLARVLLKLCGPLQQRVASAPPARNMAASAKISDTAFDYDSDKLEALALAKPWLAE